jgi:hypothetical protein
MPAWSHWPLALSLALHAVVIAFGWPGHLAGEPPLRTDFWAGETFEAPNLIEVPGGEEEERWSIGAPGEAQRAARAQPGPRPTPELTERRVTHSRSTSSVKSLAQSSGASVKVGAEPRQETSGFGAEAAEAGPRDLVRSFVRAIPAAASSDPEWATVPVGPAGSADLTLVLDDDAKPYAKEPIDPHVPAPLRRLIQKTLLVLSGGRFAALGEAPASQKLRIAVSVTQLTPAPASEMQSGGAFGLGFEPPNDQKVSRAFFTLASGRHIEVTVRPAQRP